MSRTIKLINGTKVKIYGNHTKEEIEEIKELRNNQIMEHQSRIDIQHEKENPCKFCGGNGCTGCGW